MVWYISWLRLSNCTLMPLPQKLLAKNQLQLLQIVIKVELRLNTVDQSRKNGQITDSF